MFVTDSCCGCHWIILCVIDSCMFVNNSYCVFHRFMLCLSLIHDVFVIHSWDFSVTHIVLVINSYCACYRFMLFFVIDSCCVYHWFVLCLSSIHDVNDSCCLSLMYFTDFKKVKEFYRKRPLNKTAVSPVPVSKCILVEGLRATTTEDTLIFYFENKRNLGGTVEEVHKMDEIGWLVYFADYKGKTCFLQ